MATLRKRGDKWYAEIWCKGVRKSASFPTKAEAHGWVTQTEAAIRAGENNTIPDKTFKDLLERYRDDVAAKKPNGRWDMLRLNLICRDSVIADVKLSKLGAQHIAAWRDRRNEKVSDGTVIRELNLLSGAFNYAIANWQWLKVNPCTGVTRPKKPEPRTRRPAEDEITAILHSSGYSPSSELLQITARIGAAFLFAIETAMRAKEICTLTWAHVHEGYVHLPHTKNGSARNVALSPEAVRILNQVRGRDETLCFALSTTQLDALFRKITARCMIEDLHFHDTRREALTRLSTKLDVMELARMSGHKDLKILFGTYYAPNILDTTRKLHAFNNTANSP